MESFEKKEWLNQLFDIYGLLLTEKQQSYFRLYYMEDYSLQEISEVFEVSRNAVFDHLKKAEDHLVFYEEVLCIKQKKNMRKAILDTLAETHDPLWIEALRKLDE